MRQRDDMTFPFEEYQRRVSALQARMRERLLDAVIISDPENIMYLTDYQTTGYSWFQCLIVPVEGEPVMSTREMEESNVIARTWVERTRPYSDTGDAMQMLVEILRDLGVEDGVVGYERNSYFFPAYFQDRVHGLFRKGRLQDCFGIVEEGRTCKSVHEIEIMRKAAHATELGMAAGFEAVQEGASENDIAGEICRAMFRAGGEYPAVLPYVTTGPRSMIGHATWEGRQIQPGEHAFLEVGGCYRRYHTAMMRTVILGEISKSMRRAEQLMMNALDAVHDLVRPGVTVSEVDNLVRSMLHHNEIGADIITRAGYSIGIAFPPSWDEGYIISIKQGDSTVLKEGMTFHIIPWLWGVDGDKTCGISDTIRVTDTSCESFFTLPREFVSRPTGRKLVSVPPAGEAGE